MFFPSLLPFLPRPTLSSFLFFSYFYASPLWSSWDSRKARWPPSHEPLLLSAPASPPLLPITFWTACPFSDARVVGIGAEEWTQPPWRPADWVQQSVAFRDLGESSDNRADDNIQGRSTSVLAERASALEADVLSDCWPACLSCVILARNLHHQVFISTGAKYLGEWWCVWRTSCYVWPRLRARQMVTKIVRPLENSRGLAMAIWWLSFVFLFLRVKVLVAQSCPTLCDPMDHCPLGSSLQARILEWVAICFSKGSSQLKDPNWVSLSYQGSLPFLFLKAFPQLWCSEYV